jgi:serine/threonine-protein kinase
MIPDPSLSVPDPLTGDLAEVIGHCQGLPVERLVEALREDQARRWQAGQRVPAEDYLRQYPSVRASTEAAVDLIYAEFLLRERLGDRPDTGEYLRRFPEYADVLGPQLELHRAVAAGPSSNASAAPEAPAEEATLVGGPSVAGAIPWPSVPGYEILGELGRGGMGVVYQARQVALNRLVALKMILAGNQAGPADRARFCAEAEAVARLQHPNIVQIYEVGEHHGIPYFSLEYCNGGTLAAHLAGTPLPPRQAADLVQTLTRAMHVAHQHGIIHRDLKPANVLLVSGGVVSGKWSQSTTHHSPLTTHQLKITDFGLAKKLDATEAQTASGAIVGTPSYMAPEQAGGQRHQIGPATDVYALGAILYECLTGRPPFKAATPLETVLQVVGEEPVPPARLQPSLSRDLDTICLKCLEKVPVHRYPSALALADDLRRFLEGKPIKARPVGAIEKIAKWVKRKPASAALWAVSVAAILAGGLIWLGLARAQATRMAAANAEVNLALAEATRLKDAAQAAPPGDLQPWKDALSAARRARGLLAAGEVNEDLARRVRDLFAQLEQDNWMVGRLQEIRLTEIHGTQGYVDTSDRPRAYAAAFRRYGVNVAKLPAREAGARLGGRAIRASLAEALDNWASLRDATDREHLVRIAQVLNPNNRLKQIRQALVRRDRQRLETLARAARASELSPSTAYLLGNALYSLGARAQAVAWLRRAQRQYPGDFWINNDLGAYLLHRHRHGLLAYHRPLSGLLAGALAGPLQQLAAVPFLEELPRSPGDEAIRFLSAALALRPESPVVHFNLGLALAEMGQMNEAITAYQKAIHLKTTWAAPYFFLGVALSKQGHWEEAVHAYRQAIRLEPSVVPAHMNLGSLLCDQKRDFAGAIAAFREVIRLQPRSADAYFNLGNAFRKNGELERASAAFQQAIRRRQHFADAHFNLGLVLFNQGRLDQAVRAFQQAIRHREEFAEAHYNLGLALGNQGRLDEAIAAFRAAVRLNQHDSFAYSALAQALSGRGHLNEALAACRNALRLNKDNGDAHYTLGIVFFKKDQLADAIPSFQGAIRLKKVFAPAHYNLGLAYRKTGQWTRAIAAYRQAIHFKKDYAMAHCELGNVLVLTGQFDEALAALKRGHELGSKDPRWPYPSAQWVRQCEHLVALDRRLPAALRGEIPLTAAEKIDLARFCQHHKRLYAAAARWYKEVFAARPSLEENQRPSYRYSAACAAALAGCGQGQPADKIPENERAGWRVQAIAWLRAELSLWTRMRERYGQVAHAPIRQRLELWQRDPDLAGLRDAAWLAKLPTAEGRACRQLWADVAALLRRIQPTNAP